MLSAFILICKHFLVPAAFLTWYWKKSYENLLSWLFMSLVVGTYIAFIFLTGDWHVYGYYLRYLLTVVFLIAAVRTLWRSMGQPLLGESNARLVFGYGFSAFLTLIFGFFTAWAYYGTYSSQPAVPLRFPLEEGTFCVIEGGNSPLLNQHHFFPPVAEKYSLDIVMLSTTGRYKNTLSGSELSDYFIYGAPVYSPAGGVIIARNDSLPDNSPGVPDTSRANFLGNHLILQIDTLQVVLAHLQPNSFQVAVGDTVETGDLLARVGNSGYSLSPHLHLHAFRTIDHPHWPNQGVPLRFTNRFLVRNSLYRP